MVMKSYRDLLVWQKAMSLVTEVYKATRLFPKEEVYALTSQIRRAAISIPSNIAEGQGRQSRKECLQFLAVARGSLLELETQILIAQNLGYLAPVQTKLISDATAELGKMLNGLMNSLNRPSATEN